MTTWSMEVWQQFCTTSEKKSKTLSPRPFYHVSLQSSAFSTAQALRPCPCSTHDHLALARSRGQPGQSLEPSICAATSWKAVERKFNLFSTLIRTQRRMVRFSHRTLFTLLWCAWASFCSCWKNLALKWKRYQYSGCRRSRCENARECTDPVTLS